MCVRPQVADPDVDAVYVATPDPFHYTCASLALQAGKPVLVEKPFTINANQARKLTSEAKARDIFLVEAMWTRFLPHIVEIEQLVRRVASARSAPSPPTWADMRLSIRTVASSTQCLAVEPSWISGCT
jgi:predicted dehydrogenase